MSPLDLSGKGHVDRAVAVRVFSRVRPPGINTNQYLLKNSAFFLFDFQAHIKLRRVFLVGSPHCVIVNDSKT